MNISSSLILPRGMVIAKNDDFMFPYTMPLCLDLLSLKSSVIQKLNIAIKIINEQKLPIRLFLTDDDKLTLNLMHNEFNDEKELFIDLSNNLIPNSHTALNALKKITTIPQYKNLDRKSYRSLSKWYDFSRNGDKKINTIKNNSLFAGFSSGFNDIFDSQINCYEGLLHKLANKYIDNSFMNNFNSNLGDVSKLTFVKYYQDFFNSANLDCFSTIKPDSFDSHNMWGLYCPSDKGVAFEYDISEIEKFIFSQQEVIEFLRRHVNGEFNNINNFTNIMLTKEMANSKMMHLRVLKIKYEEKYNPFTFFEKYLSSKSEELKRNISHEDNVSKVNIILENFYSLKNNQWQFEQEVRLASFHFLFSKSKLNNHPVNMEYYLRNQNSIQNEYLLKKNEYIDNGENIVPFIKPSKIFLKWNCDIKCPEIKSILEYAKKNRIPVKKLLNEIDYRDNKFRFEKV